MKYIETQVQISFGLHFVHHWEVQQWKEGKFSPDTFLMWKNMRKKKFYVTLM